MNHSLDVILDLVGTLDDSPGEETSRGRFRKYLEREVEDVGHARDLIEERLGFISHRFVTQAMNRSAPAAVYPGADVRTQAGIDQTGLDDDSGTEVTEAYDEALSMAAVAGESRIAAPFFA